MPPYSSLPPALRRLDEPIVGLPLPSRRRRRLASPSIAMRVSARGNVRPSFCLDTPPIRHHRPNILISRHLPPLRIARVHVFSEYAPICSPSSLVLCAQHPVSCLPTLRCTTPITARA